MPASPTKNSASKPDAVAVVQRSQAYGWAAHETLPTANAPKPNDWSTAADSAYCAMAAASPSSQAWWNSAATSSWVRPIVPGGGSWRDLVGGPEVAVDEGVGADRAIAGSLHDLEETGVVGVGHVRVAKAGRRRVEGQAAEVVVGAGRRHEDDDAGRRARPPLEEDAAVGVDGPADGVARRVPVPAHQLERVDRELVVGDGVADEVGHRELTATRAGRVVEGGDPQRTLRRVVDVDGGDPRTGRPCRGDDVGAGDDPVERPGEEASHLVARDEAVGLVPLGGAATDDAEPGEVVDVGLVRAGLVVDEVVLGCRLRLDADPELERPQDPRRHLARVMGWAGENVRGPVPVTTPLAAKASMLRSWTSPSSSSKASVPSNRDRPPVRSITRSRNVAICARLTGRAGS